MLLQWCKNPPSLTFIPNLYIMLLNESAYERACMKKKLLLLSLASLILSGCGNINTETSNNNESSDITNSVIEATEAVSDDKTEEVTTMAQENYKTYFPVDNRCTQKGYAVFFIYPVTKFTDEYRNIIDDELTKVWHKYFPMCANNEMTEDMYIYSADYEYIYDEQKDSVIPDILDALDNIEGISNVIITDGNYPDAEVSEEDQSYDFDEVLGITDLDLCYTAHAEGFEGECFHYNIYFNNGVADKNRKKTVSDAINGYDYGLIGDDYAGYMSVSADSEKVSVYLDLGNVQPQNSDKAIHGILLALNQVSDIDRVIINEGMS